MLVALFEDQAYENFLPLTYTRPVFECRCGMRTFKERIQSMYPESEIFLFTRDYLVPTLRRNSPPVNDVNAIDDDVLLVNGMLMANGEIRRLVEEKLSKNTLISCHHRTVLAHLKEKTARKYGEVLCKPLTHVSAKNLMKECKKLETQNSPLCSYPWDLINENTELIKEDFKALGKKKSEGTIDERAAIYGEEENVYVGKDSFVEANVTLDARDGPIYIGEGTEVHGGSRITGPTYIGDNTRIVSGLIREGCNIGDVCRIGGEVEETIIHGYANKYHTGFVGHAYIGEWVNIAADTTTSDIKNTYGTIRVSLDGKTVDSGQMKMGCFIGDYAKTSIGTKIYAGKKIGIASQMHGFIAEDIPSFTIWAKSLGWDPVELYLESAIKTQKRMMARREVKQTKEDIELLKRLFEMTAKDRRAAGVQKARFQTNFQ